MSPKINALIIPLNDATRNVRSVFFRDNASPRSALGIWDLEVELEVEEIENEAGTPVLQGVPKDPEIDLRRLADRMSGPFVPAELMKIDGVVLAASTGGAVGEHLAMLQDPTLDPLPGFDLESLVRGGWRGPLLDERPRAPFAFVAEPALAAGLELGTRRLAEFRSPEGGIRFGDIVASGELELPSVDLFAEVRVAAFHHVDGDPARTFYVPLAPAGPGQSTKLIRGRLRLGTAEGAPTSLAEAAKLEDYEGPYLVVPPQFRWLELHGGENLVDALDLPVAERGRLEHPRRDTRTWVPLDPAIERNADGLRPARTSDLIEAGYVGPYVPQRPHALFASLPLWALIAGGLAWAFALVTLAPHARVLRLGYGVASTLLALFVPLTWLLLSGVALSLLAALPSAIGRGNAS